MSADLIRLFLADLETSRGCAIVSRNQRLTAIHALARFVGKHSHAHIAWCVQVRAIPFKKPTARAVIPYLDIDKSEQARKLGLVCRSALLLNHSLSLSIEALLAVPDTQTAQGRRDRALLLFLYNSGARAEEAARLLVAELFLNASYVTILGKGDRKLQCPLWSTTVRALIAGLLTLNNVFFNRFGRLRSTH